MARELLKLQGQKYSDDNQVQIVILIKATANIQKQPSRGVLIKRCSENMLQNYKRTPMPKCDFNKVAKHTSAWVFSCKFAAYFQNTFL